MKWRTHRKRLTSYFLLGLALVQYVSCLPRDILIGGLFGDDEPMTIENTFKYAIYRINHEPGLLDGSELQFDTRRLQTSDSFLSSKQICGQITQGPIALFGPRSQEVAAFTNSLCSYLHIPHIEIRESSRRQNLQTGFSINLHPEPRELAKAYLDVINSYKMKSVLIVYGDKDGLIKMQSILREVTKDHSRNVFIRQADSGNMREVLKEAKKKSWTNIVVDLNISETVLFLKMALQEGMIDSYHHYILTTLDIEMINLDNYKYNYVNLTGFRLVDPEDVYTREITDDMYIYEMETRLKLLQKSIPYESALLFDGILLLAKALEELDKSVILRPINSSCDQDNVWPSGKNLYDYLKLSQIKGLTGDVQIHEGRRLQFKLDVMQLSESGLEKTGTWRYEEGVNFTVKYDPDKFPFGNKTLKITTVLNRPLIITTKLEAPYIMLKEFEKGVDPKNLGNDLYEGFCIDLLKEVASYVGFEYTIIPVDDGQYGQFKENKWNGLVKELIERRADMAVAALTISYLREQYIDFTKPFLNLGISILFKAPERKKPGIFSFLNPLAIEIWIYVIAAYLLVSFSIFVLARFSPYEWYNPHPCNPETDTVQNTFDLSNSFWFTVGTLMQQGSDVNPRAVSTRIVGATWWFFTLIIISSYTANLAAFLTVERMISPIESAEDLAKQNEILYGTLEGGSTQTFFKESKIQTYFHMWNFMKSKDVFVKNRSDGVERVQRGNYAYLMESTSLDYITQQNCDLMQVGGLLDSKGYGIGTPMSSPLRDKLSMAILHLQEEGKIQELYNKWWKGTGKCLAEKKKTESKANALGVDNVGGIFVVLMGGLALSVVVAFIEFVWKSRRNAREDRQSLCSEMAEELHFAVRCHGSSKKPKFKKTCSRYKTNHNKANCPLTTENQIDSPNGMLHLRELRKSPVGPGKEYKFGDGGYLHVDYSDTET